MPSHHAIDSAQKARHTDEQEHAWWHGAVIYQVYPRSLKDSNGDGIGDLPGITQSLEYIASLGVDAIWISPFFKSPMKDFGYDVSDYRAIDPTFGNMADFDALIARAHEFGLKIIIDQILSHTSDQHAWFLESKSSRDNPKADWYVWADPKEDGSPPNNWLSIFGGCAWQWCTQRRQYYLHNFLSAQPDLNFHNEEVRKQILQEVEFWLQKGVDGLRLDAINFCFHDKLLRDNPAKPPEARKARGFSLDNPYAWQYHYYNNNQPENVNFVGELRALLDRYPGTTSLGEISSEDSLQTMAEYTQGNTGLHMAYSFELLVDNFSGQHIRDVIEKSQQMLEPGRSCWAISNHDVTRAVSRWGKEKDKQAYAKLLMAFLMSLPGTLCMYQGEELGLTEATIDRDALQDPYGIAFWPEFKGRDGCRTPLPWNTQARHAGFSHEKPWLPIPEEHLGLAVDKQLADKHSTLQFSKGLLSWRQKSSALKSGSLQFLETQDHAFAFIRSSEDESLVCAFNFSAEETILSISGYKLETLHQHNPNDASFTGNALRLPPLTAFFAKARAV